ncbi:MAG: AAA family ATPase [Dehalococcoidia bacterium]
MKVIEFVGREKELCQLHERLQEAVAGQGGVALVRGEVGVGKTRLLRQFARSAAGEGVVLTEGNWYESQQTPAYVGFRECLLQLVAQNAVRRTIRPESPYVRDLARLDPEFARLLGVEPDRLGDSDEPYRLWQGVSLLLKAAARAAPTIVVLDDLQWADQGSLELLGFLGRDVGETRLLILAAYREDDVADDHPLLKSIWSLRQARSLSVINLRGLNSTEVRSMAESVSGSRVDDPVLDSLYELTQGNPLFVEEMMRDLVSREVMSSTHAPESMVALLGKQVPEGIREVMARRLSVLSSECQYFVQLAACVGRHFDFSLIGQVGDLGQPALLALTQEATLASIVEESAPGLFFFSHPLMREVVYNAMTAPSKIATHQRVAIALEAQYGATAAAHSQEIANHLVSAGSLADPRQTLTYCVEGARQARALFAFDEARRLASAGLGALERVGTDLPRLRAALLLQLGYAESVSGLPDDGLQRYRDALAIYEAQGDDEGRTDAYRWITTVLLRHGRWGEAFAAAGDGLATAAERPTHAFVGLASAYALALLVVGQTTKAALWAQKIVPLGFDDETRAVVHHALAGQHSWGIEDPEEATAHFEQARRLFLKEGRDATSAQLALDHAVASYFRGEVQTSLDAMSESERLGGATNRVSVMADLAAFRSVVYVHQGQWERAHEAWERWESLRSSLGGSTIYGQLAERAAALERFWKQGPDGAAELLHASFPMHTESLRAYLQVEQGADREEALRRIDELACSVPAGRGLFWLSSVLPLESARSTLCDTQSTFTEGIERHSGYLLDWFLVDLELGRSALCRQRWEEADQHFRKATGICQEAGLRGFLGQVHMHHGLMFLGRRATGDRRRGGELLEQAGALFTELGLDYLKANLDAVLARPSRGRPYSQGPAGLTQREQAVLGQVAKGLSNRRIAEALYISEKTVERHLENCYQKMGVANRAGAITWLTKNNQGNSN